MGLFGRFKRKNELEEATSKPDQKRLSREIGVDGDLVIKSFSDEEERQDKISIKDYRKMRDTDGTVESLFNIVTFPILASTYGVNADPEDEGEEQAEFIRRALFEAPHRGGMETPFSLVLEQALHAVFEGFELFERVYRLDEDGRLSVKKMARRDSTTITLKRDNHGGYGGARQEASYGEKQIDVILPAEKTFLFTYGKASSALYGRSAFKPIYRNWDKKRKMEYFDSVAIQSKAIKPKLLKRISDNLTKIAKSDDGVKSKALRALAKLGEFNSAAAIPETYDVTELEGGNNERIHESIERQNSEMARAFLASFSLLGSQGTSNVGSYALSSDQSDIFMIGLRGVMNLLVEHIDRFWIADLIDLNFPVGKRYYPTFYFDDITNDTMNFLRAIFTKLVEKDKVSTDLIKGIENQVASRLEIDIDRASQDDAGAEKSVKEGSGQSTAKFRRELFEAEEKVNFTALERFFDKSRADFEKQVKPILEGYMDELAKDPAKPVKLPDSYVKLLTDSYRKAYNYGKLNASDEEGVAAPKTTKMEAEHLKKYIEFIVDKQTSDIKDLIRSQQLQLPVQEAIARADVPNILITLIGIAASAWILQAISGTKETLISNAYNSGRNDVYAVLERNSDDDSRYQWSALLENSCATCIALDGCVVDYSGKIGSYYQPGSVHIGCNCIWVRITGNNKPEITGFPGDINDIYHFQTTTRDELRNEGLVGKNQTKVDAARVKKYNNIDSGKTLSDVEKNIADKNIEILAAFDSSGKKILDYTSNQKSSVDFDDIGDFNKYMRDNKASVMTHNHPGSSSYSGTDLQTAANLNIDEMRIASERYTYSIKPGKGGWPDPTDIFESWQDQYEKYSDAAEAALTAGKFETIGEAWEWASNALVASIAEEFELKYKRTRL